jgi:ubiquinone/menaquinone biosynthesis C-methylase UbiE
LGTLGAEVWLGDRAPGGAGGGRDGQGGPVGGAASGPRLSAAASRAGGNGTNAGAVGADCGAAATPTQDETERTASPSTDATLAWRSQRRHDAVMTRKAQTRKAQTRKARTGRAPRQANAQPESGHRTAAASHYLHGYSVHEQDRLYHQARFLEDAVHDRLPFRRCRHLLEVGCGVGAQTEILLRRFPELQVTGVDRSKQNLLRARRHLGKCPWAKGRFRLQASPAETLPFAADTFDAAFLCWILEHVDDAARTLAEVRRVLRSGAPIVATEVQNASFFLDPYSPHTLQYWMAFNDTQLELGGDPFVGASLGNLLLAGGYGDIRTEVKTFHFDNRTPGERAEFLAYWSDLLLSGAPALAKAGKVSDTVVDGMHKELDRVAHDPDAVFWYSFVQARARVT